MLIRAVRVLFHPFAGVPVVTKSAGEELYRFAALLPAGIKAKLGCAREVHAGVRLIAGVQLRLCFAFWQIAVEKHPAAPAGSLGGDVAADATAARVHIGLPVFIQVLNILAVVAEYLRFLRKVVPRLPEILIDVHLLTAAVKPLFEALHRQIFCRGVGVVERRRNRGRFRGRCGGRRSGGQGGRFHRRGRRASGENEAAQTGKNGKNNVFHVHSSCVHSSCFQKSNQSEVYNILLYSKIHHFLLNSCKHACILVEKQLRVAISCVERKSHRLCSGSKRICPFKLL